MNRTVGNHTAKVLFLLAGAFALSIGGPAIAKLDRWEIKAAAETVGQIERGFEDPANVAIWKKNRETQSRFQALIFTRDREKMAREMGKYLHPEFRVVEPDGLPYSGTFEGVEGFLELWELVPKHFRTHSHDFRHSFITDDPNIVVQELMIRGTVVATGEKFEGLMFDRFEFRDGKILSISPFFFNLPNVPTD